MARFYMSPLSEWQLGVTVAWICVLPKEYHSGRLLFDQVYSYDEKGIVADYDDDNGYELGRIGNYDVVMNCPIGNIGHYHAHEIIRKMLGTFPNIRAVLLVGIGGGVPNLAMSNDIRLGDVVVSSKIFAYETGRRTDTGVEMVPRLIEPEKNLAAAAFRFLSDLRQDETLLQDKMDQAASKPKNAAIYRRPAIDHLFVSDYLHNKRCQCRLPRPQDQSIMVRRQDRHEGSLLRMHIGSVGSADQLLKSAHERDRLSNRDKIICVEMEAAVVMRGNCITVRGISDYCDGHKNDDWHDYAALSAAVCAKELLQRTPPDKFNQLRRYMTPQECYSLVRGVIKRLRDELAYNGLQDADEDLAALNRTLAVISGRSDFLKLYARDNRFQRESASEIGDTAHTANQAREAEEMAANIKNLQKELSRLIQEIQSNVKQKATAAPAVTRQEWEQLNAKVEATAKEVEALKHSREALERTSKILEEISKITDNRRVKEVSDKFGSIAEILTDAYGLATKFIPMAKRATKPIVKYFKEGAEAGLARVRSLPPSLKNPRSKLPSPAQHPDPSSPQQQPMQDYNGTTPRPIYNEEQDLEQNVTLGTINRGRPPAKHTKSNGQRPPTPPPKKQYLSRITWTPETPETPRHTSSPTTAHANSTCADTRAEYIMSVKDRIRELNGHGGRL